MISDGTSKRIILLKAFVLWRAKVNCRWCWCKDLLTAFVIAIWLVLLLGVFGLFCAVRVVSFDVDFLVGFGCFWFGTLTASCPILHIVLSNGSLLLSSCSLVCLKFRIRCAFCV